MLAGDFFPGSTGRVDCSVRVATPVVGRLIPVELLGVTVSLCVQADAEARGDPGRAAGRGCGAAAGAHRVRGQRRRAPGGALPGGEDSHGCPAEGTCLVLAVPSLLKNTSGILEGALFAGVVSPQLSSSSPQAGPIPSLFLLCVGKNPGEQVLWKAPVLGAVQGTVGAALCCRRGEAQEGQGMWAVLQEELTGAFSSWQSEGQRCRNPSPPSSWEVL